VGGGEIGWTARLFLAREVGGGGEDCKLSAFARKLTREYVGVEEEGFKH